MWRKRGYISLKLSSFVPYAALAQPERVALNIAFILLGMTSLLPGNASGVLASWPYLFGMCWAALMILGGAASIHSVTTGSRASERLGCVCVIAGCLIYAYGVLEVNGWRRGGLIAVLFIVLAGSKATRLLRSLAFAATLRKHEERGDLNGR